jgi:hypothetical protein
MGLDGNGLEEIDHGVSEEGMDIEKKSIPISGQVFKDSKVCVNGSTKSQLLIHFIL